MESQGARQTMHRNIPKRITETHSREMQDAMKEEGRRVE